jgi:hypothetical protein
VPVQVTVFSEHPSLLDPAERGAWRPVPEPSISRLGDRLAGSVLAAGTRAPRVRLDSYAITPDGSMLLLFVEADVVFDEAEGEGRGRGSGGGGGGSVDSGGGGDGGGGAGSNGWSGGGGDGSGSSGGSSSSSSGGGSGSSSGSGSGSSSGGGGSGGGSGGGGVSRLRERIGAVGKAVLGELNSRPKKLLHVTCGRLLDWPYASPGRRIPAKFARDV